MDKLKVKDIELELEKHKMSTLFSCRYAFQLGYDYALIRQLFPTKVKLPENPHPDDVHLAAGVYDGLKRTAVEEYIQQVKEALEKAGVEVEE